MLSASCSFVSPRSARAKPDGEEIELAIALPKTQELFVYQYKPLFDKIRERPPRRRIWEDGKDSFFEVVIKNVSQREIMFFEALARPKELYSEGFLRIYCTDSKGDWYQVRYKDPMKKLPGMSPLDDLYYILEPGDFLVVRVYYRKYFKNFPKTLTHTIFKMKVELNIPKDDLCVSAPYNKGLEHSFWTGSVESDVLEVKLISH
jgi:hypothetical protein